ncbi:MAG TPA: tRNA (guanosine(46)-N7)-methyltransferase TrmB [Balneolales bacterium]|nr:tRNA (guanosine(46)-N7)-methyltransferase TrmB [Balneolales bacterium]
MSRKKDERFEAIGRMDNVFECEGIKPGNWNLSFFKNNNPITLELGCGKGEYVVELAQEFPNRNFIGVDIKGDRLYIGALQALEKKLANAAFLRTYVQFIAKFFDKNEIEEIWITFPDPYHSDTKKRKRLTSPFFLDIYRKIMKPNGVIHLKTDDEKLYRYTLEVLGQEAVQILHSTDDLYDQSNRNDFYSIKTTYEKRHIADGKKIKYIRFQL